MRPFVQPPALAPGAHVRVIAPSGPFDRDTFDAGLARLRARYRVTHRDDLFARAGFLAGDDARRLAELREALEDRDVDAIVAARGGWGAMRIAAAIDPALVAARPRLFVGLSDLTTLHALWARAGVSSLHGAMVAALGRASDALVERWIAAVEGRGQRSIEGLETLVAGEAEGVLLGGNLAVLTASVGTPLFPPLEGAILFLEDVGEAPYRIDRMLTQLELAGALASIRGVLLGRFTACDARADGTSAHDVLRARFEGLGVPVLAGAPAGHVDDNLEIPLGVPARIDALRGSVTFLRQVVA